MKKKQLLITIICVLALSISACGSKDEPADMEETAAEETVEAEAKEAAAEPEETDSETEAAEETAEEAETAEAEEETETAVDPGTLTFDVPEGFIENEAGYYSCEDTAKMSNIYVSSEANDGSFDNITSDALMAMIEPELEATLETDITIELIDEQSYEIEGFRAYQYSIEYEASGIVLRQLQCIVETPAELQFVTFTEIADEGFFDAFIEAAASLRFE